MQVECPYCGARGNMDETRIPPGVTRINCPRCKQGFPLPEITQAPDLPFFEETASATPPPLPVQPSPVPAAASTVPPPLPPQSSEHTPAEIAASVAVSDTASPLAPCSVCAASFPQSEMVRFGTSWVCAACKPGYVQRLAQGELPATKFRYAGFMIRLAAKMLDGLILLIIYAIIFGGIMLFASSFKGSPPDALGMFMALMVYVLLFGVQIVYTAWFLGKYRATPGKMACGLIVVKPTGETISYGCGVGRYFGEMLSGMIMYIGYFMLLFDDEKRTLHDRLCNTRVVYK